MIAVFARSLRASMAVQHLDQSVVEYLETNMAKLGGIPIPASLDPQTTTTVRSAISHAFVSAFRVVVLLCTSLSILSAVIAWRMIPARGGEADP
jgi:hypothetical protein